MTNPLRYYVVPPETAQKIVNPDPGFMANYLASRPDVLAVDTQDIFAPNSRSLRQQWTNFGLFERVERWQDADVVVCQHWFDIAMACGLRTMIEKLADRIIEYYHQKIVLFSWNHDTDGASMWEISELPRNVIVMNYNTSRPSRCDLVVPFWNVETRTNTSVPRTVRAGFRGYIGGIKSRRNLKTFCDGKAGMVVTDDRLPESAFLDELCGLQFALCPRGGGLSSYRFFEAIQCEAIPILFSDTASLPYPTLDYSEFSIRLPESATLQPEAIHKAMTEAKEKKLRKRLREVRPLFSMLGVQEAVATEVRARITRGDAVIH